MASKINFEKQKKQPKFSTRWHNRCQILRPVEGVLPQVRHLPHLLQEHGLPGAHSGRSQGELVEERYVK